ncbi:cysteine desulfurase family protein [Pacificimonas flava]|uniref:Cysteine desulfurase n=1 Tax=Pacificimonas flava TaxID=1234595 RepID=M2TR92_9SPHN|nr:cysteine desulfurase family protein [Pacificimonas flava]EMD84301.1 Cysteine desulfurase [Pacificimonas flava]MBB5279823.1 cysteine desulfurase [Pacificimonas flava]
MTMRIYLDWNATAPMRGAAVEAIAEESRRWANPSSVHGEGRSAKGRLERARESLAAAFGTMPSQLIFTSGGTEALALALQGTMMPRILVSAVEHSAVLEAAPGAQILPVDSDGRLCLNALQDALKEGPALVALMHANNETGVLQPVEEVVDLVRACGGLTLVDAVQTAGKMRLPSADFVAISAHKIGGPPGAGMLVARCADQLEAVQKGGGQERGLRGGTENLPGIAGFAAAAEAYDMEWLAAAAKRHRRLEDAVKAAGGTIVGERAQRLQNVSMIRMPGVSAASQLMVLDLAGFALSSGSACSSGKVGASHVLAAMGMDAPAAGEAVRVSSGWLTEDEDVERFAEAWVRLAEQRRAA